MNKASLCCVVLWLSILVSSPNPRCTTLASAQSSTSRGGEGEGSNTYYPLGLDSKSTSEDISLPPVPPGTPTRPYYLLLSAATEAPRNASRRNTTTPAPPPTLPPHTLQVDSTALFSMSTVAAFLSLFSAIVSPVLCAQVSRIYLILQLSKCAFASLEDIEIFFYPLQFTVGGDRSSKFFTSLIFVWPFSLLLIAIHYIIVRIAGRKDLEELERMKRKFHFPSLSITALIIFFWQPMTMSSVTVLSRGDNQWFRFMCFIGLLGAAILFFFAFRWHHGHMQNVEFLSTEQFYQRLIDDYEDDLKAANQAANAPAADASPSADATAPARDEGEEGEDSPKRKKKSSAELRKELREKKKAAQNQAKESRSEMSGQDTAAPDPNAPKQQKTQTSIHSVYIPMSSTEATTQSGCMEKLFTASGRWVDKKDPQADPPYKMRGFVDQYGYMIIKYKPGRHWFLGVEIAVSTILGILEGIRPTTDFGCWVLSVAQLTTMLLLTIGLAVLRPYLTLFDNLSFGLLALSQALAVLFLMLDVDRLLNDPKAYFSNFFSSGNSTAAAVNGTSAPGFNSTLNGTQSTLSSSDLRTASDNIAFACICIVVLKGLLDILIMIIFWRKHVAAMKKEEEEDDAEAKKGAPPSVVVGGAASASPKGKSSGNSTSATAAQNSKAGGGSDDDDEDDDDEALSGLLSIGKGKKGTGKKSKNLQEDDLSNPLLGDVPLKVSESTSGSPLRAKGSGKKTGTGRGASNHSDDGGEEMKPMDVGKKGKGKGRSKGEDDDEERGRSASKSKAADPIEKASGKKKKAR
jgi:hypothetical protein